MDVVLTYLQGAGRFVKRLPYATLAFTVVFIIVYYLELSFRPCSQSAPCFFGITQPWVVQNIALVSIFLHVSYLDLYGNLFYFIALGVPFECFLETTNSKTRYGVFLVSFVISECWYVLKFYVPIEGAFAIDYGASGMISAMIPFVVYALIRSPLELTGLRRLIPVSVGIGSGFIVSVLLQDLLFYPYKVSVSSWIHIECFATACVVLWAFKSFISARETHMKSKAALVTA